MKQRSIYQTVVILLILFSSCNNQKIDIEKERQNAVEEYIAKSDNDRKQKLDVIQKFYGVFANGDMSVLPEILAEDYTQYPSDPGQTPDIEGFVKHVKDFGSMFSDLKGAPSHIMVDGDLVFVRSDFEMTHSGTAFNIPATNKQVKISAFDLHHFNEKGKIDKCWHLEDYWSAYTQIKEE